MANTTKTITEERMNEPKKTTTHSLDYRIKYIKNRDKSAIQMSPTHAVHQLMESLINMLLIREQSMCNIDVNTIKTRFSAATQRTD